MWFYHSNIIMFLYHFGINILLGSMKNVFWDNILCKLPHFHSIFFKRMFKIHMVTTKAANINYQIPNVLSLTSMRRFRHLQISTSFGGFAMSFFMLKINDYTNDDNKCYATTYYRTNYDSNICRFGIGYWWLQ